MCLFVLIKYVSSRHKNIVAHTFAEPAVSAAEDYLRRNVSVPIQKKLGIKSNPYIKRNASYSPFFNHRVKKIVGNYLNDYYPDWRKNVMNGDTLNFPIGGNYYAPHYGGSSGEGELSLPKRMFTTLGQTETTLGSFGVQVTNNGKRPVATVLDTYDFEPHNASENTLYGKVRLWANDHLTPNSAPDNEKIHTELKLKLQYGGHIGYLRPYTYAIRKNY